MYVSHCSSNHPSFSSTLLDSIYRSFDLGEEGMGIYRQPINKNCTTAADVFRSEEELANFQRVCMIEKLMEKNKGGSRRKFSEARKHGGSFSFSSSSDSSSGGGEADDTSFPGAALRRPKQIRTGGSGHQQKEKSRENHRLDSEMNRRERRGLADQSEPKPKHEGGFLKTKSKALKIYADLKKVKQPISPGRKLATFLNSLFTTAAGTSKKHKSDADPHHSPAASKSANTSICSSASSFSRSCLSKPPSSSGKFSGVAKRSVKFFPGSVVADDDCQPWGQKALHQENKPLNTTLYSELLKNKNAFNSVKSSVNEELKVHVMEYNRRVEDAAMDFLRKTHFTNRVFDEESEEEDEDEDMESCASSDLFELDNLSAIGVERYRKELPVYETTGADAKRV